MNTCPCGCTSQAGAYIDTWLNGVECPARILAEREGLVLVEFQRKNGSTGLYQAPSTNPYFVQRRLAYRTLSAPWRAALNPRIPWIGRPRPNGPKAAMPGV